MHPKMKARRAKMAALAGEPVSEVDDVEEGEDEEVAGEPDRTEEMQELSEEVEDEVSVEDRTEEMLVAELRDRAAELEIDGRSSMLKAELIQAINEAEGDA